jgi:hypothetical protein
MKVEVYSDVSEKKSEKERPSLSPTESLIRCLDLLDFNRALVTSNKFPYKKQDDTINWIELSFLKK